MLEIPVLQTNRLTLRPLVPDDAPRITHLLKDREIAANGLGMPYPYEETQAQAMIQRVLKGPEKNHYTWGLVIRETNELIGIITLILTLDHRRGEIGYWLGKDYWNQGYATEAGRCLIEDAFTRFDLNRIDAETFKGNISSEHVIINLGMQLEGTLRQFLWHELSGEYKDILMYSILRSESASKGY